MLLFKWGWTFCSLLVARYFLLVARYFLLVARYFLLVACYFLLVARYFLLVARYFLLVTCYFLLAGYFWLVTRCFLLVARYFLFVTFSQLLWAIARLLVTRVILTQGNEDAGWVQDFMFLFSCFVYIKRIRRQGGSSLRPSSSYNKLLGRVAFKIQSNIHDGAFLRK